jgi:hypothetical protein
MARPTPDRPTLRPGFTALRRDDHTLQVGLYAPERTLVPDHPEVRRLLAALVDPTLPWVEPQAPTAVRALAELTAAGLVVSGPGPHAEQHHRQLHGAAWEQRRTARAQARVTISGPPSLTAVLAGLLTAEGVTASTHQDDRSPAPQEADALWVLLGAGPLERSLLDRAPGPTLCVTFTEGRCEIGPFTVPGSSACPRCVDAGRRDTDPRWPLLVEQASALPSSPPPADLASTLLGLTLAGHDVLTWIDGKTPASRDAIVTVLPHCLPVRTEWPRHRACGCSWETHLLGE